MLEDLVIRLLKPIRFVPADEDPHQRAHIQSLEPERHPDLDHLDARYAEHRLRQDPVAPPHADMRRAGEASRLDRDVAGRVATADHEHPLALEHLGVLVVIRVENLAAEKTEILRVSAIP